MTNFTQNDCAFETVFGKTYLNYQLAVSQKIDKKAIDGLIELHQQKDMIFAEMEACDDKETLRKYAEEVTQIYFKQQKLWGFPQNIRYHQFWEMPKCSCPLQSNSSLMGNSLKTYSQNCVIHQKDSQPCE